MFVSRKKYIRALEEWEKWENIATEARESAAQSIKIADKFEAVAISCQEDNKRILKQQKEMIDTMRKTEAELAEMRRKYSVLRRDYEVLMNDYEVLDTEYCKLEAERDHLSDELTYYEEDKKELEELEVKYGKVEEERDHYEERCRYLEGEVEDKEELEAKLNSATEHVKLADSTIFDIEDAIYRQKGDDIIQLHIYEYYKEVKHLDTK